jgi:hypothetical protein
MKAEDARQLGEDALTALAQALEAGRSEAMTEYLSTMSRFHYYSFGNAMLIAFQKRDATRVAGFHTWLKLGRWVKKGERGIVILAPMLYRTAQAKKVSADGQEEDAGSDGKVAGFKAVYVFDVSQTEGKPLPEFATVQGDPGAYRVPLQTLIAEHGITVEYRNDLGEGFGLSVGGKIVLRSDLTPAEEFSTLVHEFAHELLHKREKRAGTTLRQRELEAEAVAFIVCHAIGLDTNTASSDYIQLYRGDTNLLAASLDTIQKTAACILEGLGVKE